MKIYKKGMTNLEKIKLPKGKKLYRWQEDFLNNHDKDRVLLCAEAGCGKTISAICWLKLRSHIKALVVAPVGIQKKWKDDLKEWGAKADVVSTDTIKKIDLSKYGALVIDECQNVNSALFDKTRSQRATVLYNHIRIHPNLCLFLASATPIRSKPENLHTLYCYLGLWWPIREFRNEFLHLTDRYGRFHLEPNYDWRIKIRPYLEKVAHIVLMSDQVDVPKHEHTTINIKWTPAQENSIKGQYLEPAKEWHFRHRAEQGEEKFKELQKIMDGNRKVVVVCYYLEQIADYAKRIGNDRQVFVMTGSTKNQGEVVKQANESDDAILIIQAGLGAGFDLDRFSVMVFASMSFAFVHLVQMQARINRIHNLHSNQYVYLIGGKCDRDVKLQLDKGFDFHPPAYYNKYNDQSITGASKSIKKERGKNNPENSRILSGEIPF
jgi:hypothetical protein